MKWLSGFAGPLLKMGGTVATMAGQPEFGIPMSIAGGAASGMGKSPTGAGGGFGGAVQGAGGVALKDLIAGKMGMPGTASKDAVSSQGSPMTIPGTPGTGAFGGS